MASFRNPILPGFYPDPSLCRVGEDYYLVNSSFEYFPGVPIFHSRDLVHWRQIGHCLTRPSQLPLQNARSSQGIWAPTIRYHDGLFYMITTNVAGGGHFYVTTRDPAGEWSQPVWLEGSCWDPSLFFDDDGRAYFTYFELPDRIMQSEIDLREGRLLAPARLIWNGAGYKSPEGPHLYKINGLYYLLAAEGGTEYGHLISMARGSSPWGPFESCPYNPILSHRSLENPIQATGHGELFQAHDGSWWMVFLGIRPVGYPPAYHLGRETFLAPVRWMEDGWPRVGLNGRVYLQMEADLLPSQPFEMEAARDDFTSSRMRPCWNHLRNPVIGDYSLSECPGWLRLRGSATRLDEAGSPTFVGRRQQHFECRAAALLDFTPEQEGDEAGLVAWMNERHHYEVAILRQNGVRQVILRRRIGSLQMIVASRPAPEGPVELSVDADQDWYSFAFARPGGEATELGGGEVRYLSVEAGGMFTGVYLAMYAQGEGRPCSAPADFDWFNYTYRE